jgi:hypothetical protein
MLSQNALSSKLLRERKKCGFTDAFGSVINFSAKPEETARRP